MKPVVEYHWDEQAGKWVIVGPRALVLITEWHARYAYCRFWDASRVHSAWHATFPEAHHENRLGTGFNGDMTDPYGRWKPWISSSWLQKVRRSLPSC